jgi:hypothetical protein
MGGRSASPTRAGELHDRDSFNDALPAGRRQRRPPSRQSANRLSHHTDDSGGCAQTNDGTARPSDARTRADEITDRVRTGLDRACRCRKPRPPCSRPLRLSREGRDLGAASIRDGGRSTLSAVEGSSGQLCQRTVRTPLTCDSVKTCIDAGAVERRLAPLGATCCSRSAPTSSGGARVCHRSFHRRR